MWSFILTSGQAKLKYQIGWGSGSGFGLESGSQNTDNTENLNAKKLRAKVDGGGDDDYALVMGRQ